MSDLSSYAEIHPQQIITACDLQQKLSTERLAKNLELHKEDDLPSQELKIGSFYPTYKLYLIRIRFDFIREAMSERSNLSSLRQLCEAAINYGETKIVRISASDFSLISEAWNLINKGKQEP